MKTMPANAAPTHVKDDFFNSLSCEALEKAQCSNNTSRSVLAEMRKLDMDTSARWGLTAGEGWRPWWTRYGPPGGVVAVGAGAVAEAAGAAAECESIVS